MNGTYTDDNRLKLNTFKEMNELAAYLVRQNTVDKFATYADQHGLRRRNLMIQKSHHLLERYINSRIIYNMLDENSWHQYINQDDPAILEALRIFRDNEAFPTPSTKDNAQKDKQKKTARAAEAFDYNPLHVRPTMVVRA